jgi:hypothetical protein
VGGGWWAGRGGVGGREGREGERLYVRNSIFESYPSKHTLKYASLLLKEYDLF